MNPPVEILAPPPESKFCGTCLHLHSKLERCLFHSKPDQPPLRMRATDVACAHHALKASLQVQPCVDATPFLLKDQFQGLRDYMNARRVELASRRGTKTALQEITALEDWLSQQGK